jgi:hypothetical protein
MNISTLFNFFCGRATTFAIAFAIAGTVLAFTGHLDTNYVALITAIQGLVFAHSWKEDIMEWKNARAEKDSTY